MFQISYVGQSIHMKKCEIWNQPISLESHLTQIWNKDYNLWNWLFWNLQEFILKEWNMCFQIIAIEINVIFVKQASEKRNVGSEKQYVTRMSTCESNYLEVYNSL